MIRVLPAGWSYGDWAGLVYPEPKPRGFDPLGYLAEFFDTIELMIEAMLTRRKLRSPTSC